MLSFRTSTRQSLSDRKETKNAREINSGHGHLITNNPRLLMSLIGVLASVFGKDYTNGPASYAPPTVICKNKLSISPITRSEDSSFKPSDKTS